jgi:hypothetical protein
VRAVLFPPGRLLVKNGRGKRRQGHLPRSAVFRHRHLKRAPVQIYHFLSGTENFLLSDTGRRQQHQRGRHVLAVCLVRCRNECHGLLGGEVAVARGLPHHPRRARGVAPLDNAPPDRRSTFTATPSPNLKSKAFADRPPHAALRQAGRGRFRLKLADSGLTAFGANP